MEHRTDLPSVPQRLPWFGSALVAIGLIGGSFFLQGQFAQLLPDVIPTVALDVLVKRHEQRPNAVVFHSYDWGGYLTWRGWQPTEPRLLNWIDDRNEVQGEKHVREYFAIRDGEPGWEEKLDRDRVELVCIEAGAVLAQRLKQQAADNQVIGILLGPTISALGPGVGGSLRSAGWRQVYSDERIDKEKIYGTVIFERYLDSPP